MKILLFGTNGQVGFELARSLLPFGEVIALNRKQVDLTDLEKLSVTIQKISPDVIVNAAAYTAVDKAESERELAFLINEKAVAVFAQEAKKLNALLIHYSTDYVFDGTKDTSYIEDDCPAPLNVYGESKLAGERAVQASGADFLIFRTTWVFAARGQNFVKSILRLANEREELNIVADQIGAPTSARFIADATAYILPQIQQARNANIFISSIFNLTNSGETSWFEFARKIIELARLQGIELKNRVINPIPTSAYPTPAKRPANSRLLTKKLQQRFGLTIPTWEQSLSLCLEEIYGK